MTIQEIIDALLALSVADKKKEGVVNASGEAFPITGIEVDGKLVWFNVD